MVSITASWSLLVHSKLRVGWAAERLAAMTPAGHVAVIHVTLMDDHPWTQAFVSIEARPTSTGG